MSGEGGEILSGEVEGALAAEAESSVLAEAVDRIAHQLKNPLQAMTVNLEVIRMRAGKGDREEAERLTGVVDQNIRLVDRRIRMLIALARRSPDEALTAIDLGELLREAGAAFRLDDREDGLGLRIRLQEAGGNGGLSIRGREGALLALVLGAASGVRRGSREEESPYLAAGSGDEGPWIEVGPGTPWESRAQREELAGQARRAGGEVDSGGGDDGPFRVRFPRA